MKRPGMKIIVILVVIVAALLLLLPFFGPLVFEQADETVDYRGMGAQPVVLPGT